VKEDRKEGWGREREEGGGEEGKDLSLSFPRKEDRDNLLQRAFLGRGGWSSH
jgi:hypothetical protein